MCKSVLLAVKERVTGSAITGNMLTLLVDVPTHLEYAWYFVWHVCVSICTNHSRLTGPFTESSTVGRPQHGYWEEGQPKEQHYWIIRITVENAKGERSAHTTLL